jgi:hypothetical protein
MNASDDNQITVRHLINQEWEFRDAGFSGSFEHNRKSQGRFFDGINRLPDSRHEFQRESSVIRFVELIRLPEIIFG